MPYDAKRGWVRAYLFEFERWDGTIMQQKIVATGLGEAHARSNEIARKYQLAAPGMQRISAPSGEVIEWAYDSTKREWKITRDTFTATK